MKLVESIMTRNPCYTAGRKITVKGLMLHSVGCPQPKASAFISSWNSPAHDTSCVHGFIDGNDGTVYQTLPWNHRGWHCGSGNKGSGNNTHIGVEMCEPACIRYTAGSNFTCSDMAEAKAVAERTYEAAVELFAMLCKKYGLDPLADGAIISHREGHSRGIASNHGDPEHLWAQLGMGYTMDGFRRAVKAAMGGASSGTDGYTKIMGNAVATAEQMKAYLKAKNPGVAQSVLDMVPLYLSEGKAEGVRGDIAFAQSCLETGNFTFSGSAVTLSQNNFCGMGVTSNGMKGNSFGTPQLGIRAHETRVNTGVLQRIRGGVGFQVLHLRPDAELRRAKGIQNSGHSVFDESGKALYTKAAALQPYLVRVSIPDLNIRQGPGTDKPKTGKVTGVGVFTIVEEADGKGASRWGKLKSNAGWISLDYASRI